MTVNYQFQPADFLAFTEERRRFYPYTFSRHYYFLILPVLVVGLAVAAQSFIIAMVFAAFFVLSDWITQHYIRKAYLRKAYSEHNLFSITRLHSATITQEGLRISSAAVEVLYRWPFIRQVLRSGCYIQFELTRLQKIYIPSEPSRIRDKSRSLFRRRNHL